MVLRDCLETIFDHFVCEAHLFAQIPLALGMWLRFRLLFLSACTHDFNALKFI
jgi:hypothetical protein